MKETENCLDLFELAEADLDDEMIATMNWNLQPIEKQLFLDCWNCVWLRTCGGNCVYDDSQY